MNEIFKILAIDGGGIRGIFPAQILKRIKEELAIDFCQKMQIITGTSTGAIIAAGLAIEYPIEKIVELYKTEGRRIFHRNYSEFLNKYNWKGLLQSKYNNLYLKKILNNVFKNLTLSETKARLMIPASDASNGSVFIFKSNYDENFVRDKDIKIADAVLASCSAPTFFNPVKVKEYLLADGGLWANNPSLIALTEAMGSRFKKDKSQIRILSLGTGLGKKYYDPKDDNKDWGFKRWGLGLVSTVMNLQSINVDNIVRFILENDDNRFVRINFDTDCEAALDDVDSIDNLVARADEAFTYSFNRIKNFFCE